MRFVRWNGASWDPEIVRPGFNPSLAYDPMTRAACVGYYYMNAETRFAWRNGAGNWQSERVDTGDNTTTRPCLKFGPDGRPSLSYSTYGDLKFARRSEWP